MKKAVNEKSEVKRKLKKFTYGYNLTKWKNSYQYEDDVKMVKHSYASK